jgi:hypothetical protein
MRSTRCCPVSAARSSQRINPVLTRPGTAPNWSALEVVRDSLDRHEPGHTHTPPARLLLGFSNRHLRLRKRAKRREIRQNDAP